MKFLKKASLAAAIAAVTISAQADMVALDDATMSATTGQSGVDIDMVIGSGGISIGSITYTDTKGVAADIDTDGDNVADAFSGGSVVINTIGLSGISAADYDATGAENAVALNIGQTIDVTETGDLVLGMSTPADVYMKIGVGSVELQDNSTGSTNLNSELVNSMSAIVQLGADSRTIIHNVDLATETVGDYAGATNPYAAQKAGLVISSSMAVRVVDLDVSLFGYTQDQADAVYGAGTPQAAAAAGAGAVNITDLSFESATGGTVDVSQTIWAQADGVYIAMGNIEGNLNIGDIAIGGASVGSVQVSGLNLNGLTQRISGH